MRNMKMALVVVPLCLAACGGPAEPAASPQSDLSLLEDEPEGAAAASSGKVQKGMDAIAAEDFEGAKEVLTEAVSDDPKDPQAAFYLGVALGALGENDAAVASLTSALTLEPKFPEASLNLSALLLDMGKADEALEAAEQGLKAAPQDALLLQNRALALLDAGDTGAAATALEAVVEQAPENDEMRFLLAQALLGSDRQDDALVHLRKLLKSRSVEVLASAADLFGRLKQWDDCVAALDSAVAKKDAAELHVKRGLCLHGKTDEDAAKKAFETAIEKDAGSAKAHFYLGHNLRARGDKAAAKAAFLKAAELAGEGKLAKAASAAAGRL